ncbi:histone-lysine N-methyltransferase 2D isoform X2 [Astyanax mexicanus]|uniref:histone-lysine N-methyltransferase 2D isoform X2 n=1 Tax=Astyanax mexicanus TaxID=7994 RepID=UPI0020CAC3AA|nr:histone-lysine N-methyltransferase 2D isoform X2 [Astyanax mexicanus]
MAEEDSDSSLQGVCCILCKTDDENRITGPLLSKEDISAHENCMVFSSGIYCKNSPSFDDLCGFDVEDVKAECSRGKKLKCHYCKKNGATVGCEEKKCKRSYHYPCAIADRARCVEEKSKGLYMLYCPKHDPKRPKNFDLANESDCSDAGSNTSKTPKLDNSHQEASSGKCHYCKKSGATVECEEKKCKRSYHYPCAIADRARCVEKKSKGLYMLYCPKHDPKRPKNFDLPNESDCSDAGSNTSKRPKLDNSHQEASSGSDSVSAPSRPRNKKRQFEIILSDSDTEVTPLNKKKPVRQLVLHTEEAGPCDDNQMIAPLDDSDLEIIPEKQQRESTPIPEDQRNKTREEPISSPINNNDDNDDTDIEEIQETYKEPATAESQSMMESEFRHESVPLTIISDSGPFSIDSENSIGTTSPSFVPGQAAPPPMSSSHGSLSAPEPAATVPTPTITTSVINPPEPDCPSVDSPPLEGASAAEPADVPNHAIPTVPSRGESDFKEEREQPACTASRNTLALNMSHDLPESHAPPIDHPLIRAASPGCSTSSTQTAKGKEESLSGSGAALFWRRCNEMGCTKAIFSELTNQISSLAGRVQSQHATQQDYAVSLRILKASGKLPALFQQLDQDFEEQERELKRKREALKEARDLLKNHPIDVKNYTLKNQKQDD